jgi:NADH dehydrogenase
MALFLSQFISKFVNDVILTREEIDGLMSNLLISDGPPTSRMRLSDWLTENAATVGAKYASELARHYRS